MDTTKYNAQNAGGLDHGWDTGHTAVNGGAMDKWVSAKGERTMGYFTRQDIPYQYALADAFTICDGYFCSMNGPTDPNRLYLWTGTAAPARDGTTGPWTDNTPVTDNPVADWTTYAERLEKAGVSWRVYHNPDGSDDRNGDYDDNALSYFKQFHAFPKDDPRYVNAMTRFDLTGLRPALQGRHAAHGLLAGGALPVLRAPGGQPRLRRALGQHRPAVAVLQPRRVGETVFLLMYDENDGYFDHVIPPFPEPGTPDEFVDGQADRPRQPGAAAGSSRRGRAAAGSTPRSSTTPRCCASSSASPASGAEHLGLAARGLRRPHQLLRLHQARLQHPGRCRTRSR